MKAPIIINGGKSIACLIISGIINVFSNYLFIKFLLEDYKYNDLAENLFAIAYGVWQLTNLVCCIISSIDEKAAKSLKIYLRVNEIFIAIVGGLLAIALIVGWVMLHCVGDYCLLIDLLFGLGLAGVLGIGLTGFFMLYEALKSSKKIAYEFAAIEMKGMNL